MSDRALHRELMRATHEPRHRPPDWITHRIDRAYVEGLEEMCVVLCRHANQADLGAVEDWPLPLLFRRYEALLRVIRAENEQIEKSRE